MLRFKINYDFDIAIDRSGTFSVKWDSCFLKERFKTDDVQNF